LKTGLIGALVAGVVVFAGGGFYAYKKFLAPKPAPSVAKSSVPIAVILGKDAPAAGSIPVNAPPPTAAAPAVTAGQPPAVTGGAPATPARERINSAIADQQASLNEVLAADRPAPGRTAASASPAAHAATGPAGPDPAFQAWVAGVHIGGVRIGEVPRIFIDGVTYKPGDLVKPELGIRFDSADAGREVLIFKDRTGVVLEKKF
jgi:hypothetical protein